MAAAEARLGTTGLERMAALWRRSEARSLSRSQRCSFDHSFSAGQQ